MTVKDVKSLAIRHACAVRVESVNYVRAVLSKSRAIPDAMAWRHHDSDINDPVLEDGFNASDVQMLTERIIDLRPVPSRLLFQAVTMSEYLRFPFLYGASILKGPTLTPQDQIEQHSTCSLSEKTKRGVDEGEGSLLKVKRKKTFVFQKDSFAASEHVSSLEPLRAMCPTGPATENPSGAAAETAESQEDRSLHIPPHDSANRFVYDDRGLRDNKETNSLRLGSFVDQSGRNLTLIRLKCSNLPRAIISYIVALPLKERHLLPGFPCEVLTLMKGSHPETKLTMCPSGPSARDVTWIPLC
nr:hypothetical protein [Tanacetum cinerariifolium]